MHPLFPANHLSLADESRERSRQSCSRMRQTEGRRWREIREVPLLRDVFAASESDELTNYRNQVTQAQWSIPTDISRNLRQHSKILDLGERWPSKIAALTCILTFVLAGRNSRRCSGAAIRRAREGACSGRPSRDACSGFRGSDLDVILATAGVTKGALHSS